MRRTTVVGTCLLVLATTTWSCTLAAEQLLPVRTVAAGGSNTRLGVPVLTPSRDSLLTIAQIYAAIDGAITFGDTDHDGLNEVILAVADMSGFGYRILEESGNNTYHEEFIGPDMDPFAVGDLDKDGKSEILGQAGYQLELYEATSPSTYPTNLVWSSPPLSNVIGRPTIADTDRDGNMEIINSVNPGRLVIFENRGDNTFVQVYSDLVPGYAGRKVVADLDGDGRMEIVFATDHQYLYAYESPSNDVWQQTFVDTTRLDNANVSGGLDTDGNGKPELFVAGDKYIPGQGFVGALYVYEAACNNRFVRVATLTFDELGTGFKSSAVADIDGVGRPEYILHANPQLDIFRAVAPGEWAMTVGAIDPDMNGKHIFVNAFDVNRNGRSEIFWSADGSSVYISTLVLEHPLVPVTDVYAGGDLALERLTVVPNPCRTQATLILGQRSRLAATSIAVFDVSGHLVSRQLPIREASGQILWPARSLPSGIYFVRVDGSSGKPLAMGRTAIVR